MTKGLHSRHYFDSLQQAPARRDLFPKPSLVKMQRNFSEHPFSCRCLCPLWQEAALSIARLLNKGNPQRACAHNLTLAHFWVCAQHADRKQLRKRYDLLRTDPLPKLTLRSNTRHTASKLPPHLPLRAGDPKPLSQAQELHLPQGRAGATPLRVLQHYNAVINTPPFFFFFWKTPCCQVKPSLCISFYIAKGAVRREAVSPEDSHSPSHHSITVTESFSEQLWERSPPIYRRGN